MGDERTVALDRIVLPVGEGRRPWTLTLDVSLDLDHSVARTRLVAAQARLTDVLLTDVLLTRVAQAQNVLVTDGALDKDRLHAVALRATEELLGADGIAQVAVAARLGPPC